MRRVRLIPVLAALAGALVAGTAGGASPPPAPGPRIVSINPCIDAILMEVADPRQIIAISRYSQDPRASSIAPALAARFKATSGTAEEVVALAPDVVLSGAHVDPATVRALQRMHIALVQYPVPQSVAESIVQVRAIASLVGHPNRGTALAARIAAAAVPLAVRPVPALIRQSEGLVPGAGTLSDELLRRAGFRNLSAAFGLKQWDVLPLEYLIARPPRVLLSVDAAEAGGDRLTDHPAIRALGRRIIIAPYPASLLVCGGPTIIPAMARLKAVRMGAR